MKWFITTHTLISLDDLKQYDVLQIIVISYHIKALHQTGLHSPACRCRSFLVGGKWKCHWHRGILEAYRQLPHRTPHQNDPHSRYLHHTPSSWWCTFLLVWHTYTDIYGNTHTYTRFINTTRHRKYSSKTISIISCPYSRVEPLKYNLKTFN